MNAFTGNNHCPKVLFEDIQGAVRFVEGAPEAISTLCAKYAVYIVTTVRSNDDTSTCEQIRELVRGLVPSGLDMRVSRLVTEHVLIQVLAESSLLFNYQGP